MRFTSSRAMPSRRNSSLTVMSSATVSEPSLATSQPGMSSEITSTSESSTTASSPLTVNANLPCFSNSIMSCCDIAVICAARSFIILPNFGPSFLKSGFTFFTSTPSSLPTNLISFTLTSFLISALIASTLFFCASLITGTIIIASG